MVNTVVKRKTNTDPIMIVVREVSYLRSNLQIQQDPDPSDSLQVNKGCELGPSIVAIYRENWS
jgi:hypothetical protein